MFQSIWRDIKERFQYGDTTIQLILINVIIWVTIIVLGLPLKAMSGGFGAPNPIVEWLAVPSGGIQLLTRPWTIITYMFLHEGLLHIFFNMMWLYFFGQILANYLGNNRIIPVYILGGLVGFLFYFISANFLVGTLFRAIGTPMLGASAGVMAVVAAAATIAPRHSIRLMFIGSVQIRYIAIFMILLDLIAIQSADLNTGGSLAHLGGVAAGILFVEMLRRGQDWSIGINRVVDGFRNFVLGIQDWFKSLNAPKPKPQKKAKATSKTSNKRRQKARAAHSSDTESSATPSGQQAKIDSILDKIKESGYDSLSKEEKDFLFKISNK